MKSSRSPATCIFRRTPVPSDLCLQTLREPVDELIELRGFEKIGVREVEALFKSDQDALEHLAAGFSRELQFLALQWGDHA